MLTETQNIQRAYCVTRACGPTVRATVYPAVLAPLPAYGTRLRGITLIDCKSQHSDGGICTIILANGGTQFQQERWLIWLVELDEQQTDEDRENRKPPG